MIIKWFIDGEVIFETIGQLPFVGDTICLTDYRGGIDEKMYKVVESRHRVVLVIPTDFENTKGWCVYKLKNPAHGGEELSQHGGEVFLEEVDRHAEQRAKMRVVK